MISFFSRKNFKSAITKGVLLRLPDLDIVRVHDVGLRTRPESELLEFAASETNRSGYVDTGLFGWNGNTAEDHGSLIDP